MGDKINRKRRHSSEIIIGGKYKLIRKLGNGSFGDIYQGVNLRNGEKVAIKMENADVPYPQLHHEYKLYRILKNYAGIPRIHNYFGNERNLNVLVMDLLGPSLENLFNFCKHRFTLKTVLMLCEQMLCHLAAVHRKSLIHRDIKPDNFLMGIGSDCNRIFLVDFGLSKPYRESNDKIHIPYRENKKLIGTARYASINAHRGIEQSRRDDMISLGYVLMYFNKGKLPWQGIQANNLIQKYESIHEVKISTSAAVLCKNYPEEFLMYFNYCQNLHFEEKPDYGCLIQMFRTLFIVRHYKWDFLYDWVFCKKQSSENAVNAENAAVVNEQRIEELDNDDNDEKIKIQKKVDHLRQKYEILKLQEKYENLQLQENDQMFQLYEPDELFQNSF